MDYCEYCGLGENAFDWKVIQDNGDCYHHLGVHQNTLQPLILINKLETASYISSNLNYKSAAQVGYVKKFN